jgi:alpha/beta superfamily hydrolase
VRFGPSDRLYGILSVPDATSTAPAIIFLNTNFEYRVGPHRLYVPLARELAAQGHVVLRYDLGGIGDSEPHAGAAENVAYPAHAIDDAREAIAFIRKLAPGRRLIVAGLCSGGWHVFCAARAGLPVDAIVSVNPPLYLRDGSSSTRLRDAARWARALRRPLDVRVMRSIRRHLTRRWVHNQENGSYRRFLGQKGQRRIASVVGSPLFDGLARDLDSISARGVTSFFVFSRGDKGFEYFQLYASAWLHRRKARNHIRHLVVDDAGHTFSPPEAQRRLREIVIDFVIHQTSRDGALGCSGSGMGPLNCQNGR